MISLLPYLSSIISSLLIAVVTTKYLEKDPDEDAHHAFALFDDERKGAISLGNLQRVAAELGENLSDEVGDNFQQHIYFLVNSEHVAVNRSSKL